ncbi:AAA family ATPase [Sedimentisphaera salicampi]|uniref:Cell division ATP-binding protein FtsE n=1 Tax=Sedimentisphaera salicampi TaxID=1941349 RepID=A0A1W6LQ49_9BACT|nr:ATP-binding protein [Sedimentisphaera salicampi]ARN57886.1 cell division ATP-binding protein FtsE [Sedimentisphaera salicampi]
MKISVQNMGPIEKAEFELGDFTIICGKNNTGKTYATYALYGFIDFFNNHYHLDVSDNLIKSLLEDGTAEIPLENYSKNRNGLLLEACNEYTKLLPHVFAANKSNFHNTKFQVSLEEPENYPQNVIEVNYGTNKKNILKLNKPKNENKIIASLLVQKGAQELHRDLIDNAIGETIRQVLFSHLFPKPFIISAERTGAAIFRSELNFARNRLLEEVSSMENTSFNPFALINKVYADYALPVKRNVEFIRNIENVAKKESFVAAEHSELLQEFCDIIGGSYKVTSNDELYFIPNKDRRVKLTMDESSSSVRSLLDLGFYLKHICKKGDLLIVDEPELNLHPENQRKIARLFARLINIGIKIFVTTHSDYLIKELNSLIMFDPDNKSHLRIMEKENYSKEESLSASKVKVYVAEKGKFLKEGNKRKTNGLTLNPADIDDELGIEVASFDESIETMDRIQNSLLLESGE